MSADRIANKSEHYAREAIVRLFTLQLRAGSTVEKLRGLAHSCISAASNEASGAPATQGLDMSRLGSVLRTWHKETQYLTRAGLPRSLRVEGKFGLRSLVATYYPRGRFAAVFAKLKEARLIEGRSGERWAPTARHARISELSQETLTHLSEGVARFVETVTQNASVATKEDLLFERCCKVTSLPYSEVSAFREFVRQQAFTFLLSVDDWLESKVAKRPKSRAETCAAGVFTFAYVDDASTEKQRRKPKAKFGR
jgi:hypothetical protein